MNVADACQLLRTYYGPFVPMMMPGYRPSRHRAEARRRAVEALHAAMKRRDRLLVAAHRDALEVYDRQLSVRRWY